MSSSAAEREREGRSLEILPGDMIVIGKVGSNFTPRLITKEKRGVLCPKNETVVIGEKRS